MGLIMKFEIEQPETQDSLIQKAYDLAVKARDENDPTLLDDIIGYLGQYLDE